MKITDIRNNEQLQQFVATKNKAKYIFFWGHQETSGKVTKSCFSQWYESSFEIERVKYQTAEHFMMAEKARLFGDAKLESKIIAASNPGEAKALGRSVANFSESLWNEKRFNIVVQANLAKFRQNPSLQEFLLNTGDRILVEASPVDKIWGIGLAQDSPHIDNPFKWKGLNLLGYALMEVRSQLQTTPVEP
ncbi:NADAR family protein [Teredinibacter sp. KSP-S5-2]|uniref:NADAR family protein n=1 Tax=Teredinibacter sp. KSP-S5-2 TaxID=3034506 RepID=UPI00293496DD|nr:NADAR family protein [Teredinibacter sp. KSP-S5-2]WNO10874.1 NADAR family protein [Teredinibacter sp. KSP-S5-2]